MPDVEEFPYSVKRSRRARRLRLCVHEDGHVTLTVPWNLPSGLGEKFMLERRAWILKQRSKLQARVAHRQPLGGLGGYLEHREQAKKLVLDRLARFNRIYGFQFSRVCVRNNSSRWGSCSKKGNLNFHYKIIFLPDELVDYLIVHELCHLQEFNHAKTFWRLVSQSIPNHLECRKKLRAYRC